MQPPARKPIIGLTVSHARQQINHIWTSGAWQNVIFLYLMYYQSDDIEVVLVNHSLDPATEITLPHGTTPLMPLEQAIEKVDLLIEIGIRIGADNVQKMRDLGKPVVFLHVGHNLAFVTEDILFKLNRGITMSDGSALAAIWVLPHHFASCQSLYEITWRCPVAKVPYLYDGMFIDHAIAQSQLDFGYKPEKNQKIGVFEANINVLKSCITPMLIAEQAYRLRPDLVTGVHITNTEHLRPYGPFNQFAHAFDITKTGIASYDNRYPLPDFLALHAQYVLSHQWDCGLNNLYFDALYGRYPLIHNSPFLQNVGYYYPDFDAQAGAERLIYALEHHNDHLRTYQETCKAVLHDYSIYNPKNIQTYTEMALNLIESRNL